MQGKSIEELKLEEECRRIRRKREADALAKARLGDRPDWVSWRIVLTKKTPVEMADCIRILSHRSILTMDRLFYKNPGYITNLIGDMENLALDIEKCDTLKEAKEMVQKVAYKE